MNELTRLSQLIMEETPLPRASVNELQRRGHRRHVKRRALTAISLAVVVAAAFSVMQIGRTPPSSKVPSTQLAAYYQAAVNIPSATLESVGLPSTVTIPNKVTPSLSTVATNGVVSYIGAEYCPYCALQRWALLVALSKFGTFHHLDNEVFSSSSDVYPRLASWSFLGATFTSKYFKFEPTELTSLTPSTSGPGGYRQLERMTSAQRIAFNKFNSQGALPFVDIGNHYVTVGASSSPSVLEGLTLGEIGIDLRNPGSPVAQAVDGSANYLIAALCTMTQTKTPAVCSTSVIRAASKALASGISPTTATSGAYPTQPPTSAPIAVWRKWSVAEHKWWVHAAATYQPPNPACTVIKISVTGRKLSKPLFGIPKGVWLWGMSLVGHCPKGEAGGLSQRAK
jgi:hypothetical protein